MYDSLKGLEFETFENIPDYDSKLSEFLNNLDEEMRHWRGCVGRKGERRLSFPAAGYACLDVDRIVAISYYISPQRFSIHYLIEIVLRSKGVETGAVTKKEYQRRGISKHLSDLKDDMMRKRGYRHYWSRVDSDNTAILNWAEKRGMIPVKRTRKTYYYITNLYNDHSRALRLKMIIELITLKTVIIDFVSAYLTRA